jgi:hypothetical protein
MDPEKAIGIKAKIAALRYETGGILANLLQNFLNRL